MKFISLMSSGIDSPVSTYLLSRRGENIVLVHADLGPYIEGKTIETIMQLAAHLKTHISGKIKIYFVPHGPALSIIKEKCKNKYICILCKRMLLRYAEQVAANENAAAIITGDSLGQVASQTLYNIRVIEQAICFPILRPLIGLDKEEIIQIAKRIGTYNISIIQSHDCTAVPQKPTTKAQLDQVLKEEKKIQVDRLLTHALQERKLISL